MSAIPDWATAHGPAVLSARIRAKPTDFAVTERLDVEFSNDGEHDWLWIEKTGANTAWVAEQLADCAGGPVRDVGYAGLKDRNAVTRQWFSVRRPSAAGTAWNSFSAEGVNILTERRHRRKLQRGAHRGNDFRIALRGRGSDIDQTVIEERLEVIATCGVPNYFGAQRFGRDGGNVDLGRAVLAGKRMSRHKRGLGISALRSFEFNTALDARVRDATWNRLLAGDVANLDGTGSVFEVDAVSDDLERRCAELDIHPAGTLPELPTLRVAAGHRSLRLRVIDLRWEFTASALWLEFRLQKGGFATTVIREIAAIS